MAMQSTGGSATTPRFPDMPFAEKIETIPSSGAPMKDIINTEDIDEELDAYNEDFEIVDGGGCNGCRVSGAAEGVLLFSFVFGVAAVGRRRRR